MTQASPEMTFESQDPAIQAEVDSARIVADQANDTFDRRLTAAETLVATMSSNGGVFNPEMLGDYSKANEEFSLLKSAAETLMPPIAVFETFKVEADESLATSEVWGAMSREQQAFALEARTALAAGKLKEHGVTEDSLRVLMTEVDGKNKFTLVHTGAGVDIGDHGKDYDKTRSYRSVISGKNDELFQVEVNGVIYDSRSGMKAKVYDAKVQDARDRDVTLPDSQQLAQETGDVWTWTMLTGESLTADGYVQIRDVREGEVYRDLAYPGNDVRFLRVCPAVVIE